MKGHQLVEIWEVTRGGRVCLTTGCLFLVFQAAEYKVVEEHMRAGRSQIQLSGVLCYLAFLAGRGTQQSNRRDPSPVTHGSPAQPKSKKLALFMTTVRPPNNFNVASDILCKSKE